MIESFRDPETERIFNRERSRKLPYEIQQLAYRKLRMLDCAKTLGDLKVPPGNRLERLRGLRLGQHSVRINRQWRLCFQWRNGNAFDVEIVDYH